MSAALTPRQQSVFDRLVEALIDGGRTHEVEDVVAALRRGDAQAWTGENDSIVVTEILIYPQRKVLRYWLAAGDMDDLTPLLPKLEDWGRAHGATLAEAIGRRGWAPHAAAHGYQPAATVYRKEIG